MAFRSTSRLPTRRAVVIAGAGLLLILAASTAQAGWIFVLAAGVLALVVGSAFVRHRLAHLGVSRSLPPRVRVGDEIRVGLTVVNEGKAGAPLFRLVDRFPAFEDVVVACAGMAPDESTEIELVRTSSFRGVFPSGVVEVSSGAPFGMMRSRRKTDVQSQLRVVPNWVELRTFPILEPSSVPSDVLHERAHTGAGEEYLGVRDYRPGDPRRFVHWRSSARAGHLVVREYEQETSSRVGLLLSGVAHGEPPDTSFEMLVRATASVGLYALSTGHPVEVACAAGEEGIRRISSPGRHELLDWLAEVQPVDAPLAPLVTETIASIGRRGTVVVFAPSAGRAGAGLAEAIRMIQAAGARAIVVVARSATWSGSGDHSAAVLGELQGGRAPVRPVAKGEDLARCLQA